MKNSSDEGKSLGDVLNTLLKKALRHHIILIADMIFAAVYVFHLDGMIGIIKDVDWFIKVSSIVFFAGAFFSIQYLIYHQLRQDTTITEIVDKGEAGEKIEIKRGQVHEVEVPVLHR